MSLLADIIAPVNRYLLISCADGPAALGIFDIAHRIAMFGRRLPAAFSRPLFSAFGSFGQERMDDVRATLTTFVRRMLPALALGIATFWLVGEELLQWLFEFPEGDLFHVMLILVCGYGLASLGEPFFLALLALKGLSLVFAVRAFIPVIYAAMFVVLHDEQILVRFPVAYATALGANAVLLIVAFRVRYR